METLGGTGDIKESMGTNIKWHWRTQRSLWDHQVAPGDTMNRHQVALGDTGRTGDTKDSMGMSDGIGEHHEGASGGTGGDQVALGTPGCLWGCCQVALGNIR